MTVDLNADAGESFGPWKLGHDEELFGLLTSVNLACGFHAGDPLTLRQAIRLAQYRGVAVGAHPGYPDRVGFGRRHLEASPEEVYADTLYQIGALAAFLRVEGLPLHHLKPHGALYNRAARDAEIARAIAQAVRDYDPTTPLVGMGGSALESEGRALGLRVVLEAFPERGYTAQGLLAPRGMPGAVIQDPAEAARRAVQMVLEGWIETVDGHEVALRAETLCIHGDHPNAPQIARHIRAALEAEGITCQTF